MNDLLRIQPTRIYIFLCIFERPNFPVSSLLRLAIGRPFQVDDRSSGINSMTTLLPASLQNSLQEIVQRSNQRAACIRAILLSTTEGVPLGRVIAPATTSSTDGGSGGGESNALQEDGLAAIESVWAPASKQFPVLGLEKVRQITAIYDHGTLVHIYQAPMVSFFSLYFGYSPRLQTVYVALSSPEQ
jgi:hypothetical protein